MKADLKGRSFLNVDVGNDPTTSSAAWWEDRVVKNRLGPAFSALGQGSSVMGSKGAELLMQEAYIKHGGLTEPQLEQHLADFVSCDILPTKEALDDMDKVFAGYTEFIKLLFALACKHGLHQTPLPQP